MKDVSLLVAFSAGLLSFLSPCVLPLVPAYISYLTGVTVMEVQTKKTRFTALYKSIGFVIGFSIIFILLGASVSSLGKLLTTYQEEFRKIGGTLIILFGLHTSGFLRIKLFYHEKRFLPFDKLGGNFSSLLMGMAFAAGWTPCVGPILSSILIYAGSIGTLSKGIILLCFYSLGLAVPFVLTAAAIGKSTTFIRKFSKYLPYISVISGILMVIMGVLIFTNKLTILSRYLNFVNFF